MAKFFRLIFIHGFTNPDAPSHNRRDTHNFLSWRFPGALVDDFGFSSLASPQSDCYRSIHEQATDVLEALLASFGLQDEHCKGLPIVFIGCGLGGLLMKRILLVATETSKYHAISQMVVGMFFVESPHRAATVISWERYLVRAISTSDIGHESPRQLLQDLPHVFIQDAEAFSQSSWPFVVVDIFQPGQENSLYHVGSLKSRSSLSLQREQNIELSTSTTSATLNFSSSKYEIQFICDRISSLISEERQPIQIQFSEFLSKFLAHNLGTPCLNTQSSVLASNDVILQSATYQEWISLENAEYGVLHVDGLSKSRTMALERTVLDALLSRHMLRPALLLSVHVAGSDPNAQSPSSVFSSLCHQLFLARPALYTHVQSVCSFMLEQHLYSTELLMSLFENLVLHCADVTIYCVIHSIDLSEKPLWSYLAFFNRLIQASRGDLQVLLTSTKVYEHELSSEHGICRHVRGWTNTETPIIGLNKFIHENVRRTASTRNMYEGSEYVIISELSSSSSPLTAMQRLAYLESAEMRSSIKATWEQIDTLKSLQPFPETIFFYRMANSRYDWLQTAFRWILHAYRPLTTSELATAVAFGEFGIESDRTLAELMPYDIAGDLLRTAGRVIKVVKDRVVPVHQDLYELFTHGDYSPTTDHHFSLLAACLQYISYVALPPSDHRGNRVPQSERNLLTYASENWLLHYKAVSPKLVTDARNHVFEFLDNKECLALWADHFRPNFRECSGHSTPTTRLQVISYLGLVELLDLEYEEAGSRDSFQEDMSPALEKAALTGNVEIVEWLIKHGASSEKALSSAAAEGHVAVMEKLATPDTHLNATDRYTYAAWHNAACNGHLEALVFLIGKDSSLLNLTISKHGSALCLAAKLGHTHCVQYLLGREADISIKDSDGHGGLALAAKGGFTKVLELLLDRKRTPQSSTVGGNTLLHLAAQFGHLQTVELLLDYFPEVHVKNVNNITPLYMAVEGGFLDVVLSLLKAARLRVERVQGSTSENVEKTISDITQRTQCTTSIENPLWLAVERNDYRIVEELLENQPQFEMGGYGNILLMATTKQSAITVELLLAYGGQEFLTIHDDSGNTILHQAAKRSGPEVLSTPLDRIPPDHDVLENGPLNYQGWTPLHIAADLGHVLVVQVLLGRSVDINAQTPEEDTPLILAVRKGHSSVVLELLQNSATDIQLCNEVGDDALSLAAREGNIDIIENLFHAKPTLGFVLHHDTVLRHLNDVLEQAGECDYDKPSQDDIELPLDLPVKALESPAIELLSKHKARLDTQNDEGRTPVSLAADKGLAGVVKLLIQKRASLNLSDNENKAPLFFASYNGHTEVVKEILNAASTVDVNLADSSGWTPLHAAYDNADITKLLLARGATTDTQTYNSKSTPLAMAAHSGCNQVVSLHLEANADPNIQDDDGETVLHRAMVAGDMEVVKLLVDHRGTKLNEGRDDNSTPLHLAASNEKNAEIALLLLDKGVDLHKKSDLFGTVLIAAAIGGNISLVTRLIEAGCEVDEPCMPYNTALQAAAYHEQLEVVKLLISKGADPNIIGGRYGSALCAALASRSKEIESLMRVLLFAGARVRDEEVLVAFEGDMDIAARLLIEHVDPGNGIEAIGALTRDKFGRSPLSNAILTNRQSIFDMLLDRPNINMNGEDNSGQTPLMFAAMSSNQHFLQKLLERSMQIDVDAFDSEGKTALMHACIMDASDAVNALVECADTTVADRRGRQALYWAARRSSIDVFDVVKTAMVDANRVGKFRHVFDHDLWKAMHAAIASNRASYIDHLLEAVDSSYIEPKPDDGWTLLYTAQKYGFETIEEKLRQFRSYLLLEPLPEPPRLPSAWSDFDKTPCLRVDEDGQAVSVDGSCFTPGYDWNLATMGTLRADYPMAPIGGTDICYFHVTIKANKDPKSWAIGFCEGEAELNLMLGWAKGSWGYHSDDGVIHGEGRKYHYGEPYDVGDVVGCGINFKDRSAFFTKNGHIIGKAFENIAGKLYPAVSVDQTMAGASMSAKFWNSEKQDFRDGIMNFSESPILKYPETRTPFDSDKDSVSDAFQLDVTVEDIAEMTKE